MRKSPTRPCEHEPSRTRTHGVHRPPVNVLFVYKLQSSRDRTRPGTHRPRSRARGPLYRRVRAGDDRHRACLRGRPASRDDLFSRATISRRATARSHSTSGKPVIGCGRRSANQRRRLPASCARGLGLLSGDEPAGELDLMVHMLNRLPVRSPPTCVLAACRRRRVASPRAGSRRCFQYGGPEVDLFPAALDPPRPWDCIATSRIRGPSAIPLRPHLTASGGPISSTLGGCRARRQARHASRRCEARGLADNDLVRVFTSSARCTVC